MTNYVQPHTFQTAARSSPAADDAIRRLAGWVRPQLGLSGQQCAS
jgi:hypothetical protein